MKLLVVEDEKRLCDNIAKHLRRGGYAVETCYEGSSALDLIRSEGYDAVVLDIMLPGINGLEILRRIRGEKISVPVILLTAMDRISDRIHGLDSGADDYLTKPFSLEELSARLRAVIRRQAVDQQTALLQVGDLTLNTQTRTAVRDGHRISLTAKEYAVLEYLMHNRGIVITREQMMRHIWNHDYELQSNIVDVYIRTLRRKIDDGFSPKLIRTLRGTGYVLTDQAEEGNGSAQ